MDPSNPIRTPCIPSFCLLALDSEASLIISSDLTEFSQLYVSALRQSRQFSTLLVLKFNAEPEMTVSITMMVH